MNDLNQINAANARAILHNIPDLTAKGHHVVVEYAGLHVIGCENFSGPGAADRAKAKVDELNARGDSSRGILHAPADLAINGGGSGCIGGGSGDITGNYIGEVRRIETLPENVGGDGAIYDAAPSSSDPVTADHLAERLGVAA